MYKIQQNVSCMHMYMYMYMHVIIYTVNYMHCVRGGCGRSTFFDGVMSLTMALYHLWSPEKMAQQTMPTSTLLRKSAARGFCKLISPGGIQLFLLL